MKKLYIAPETNVYNLNSMSFIAGSVDSGSVPIIEDNPVDESEFTDPARNNNGGNIWDNAW